MSVAARFGASWIADSAMLDEEVAHVDDQGVAIGHEFRLIPEPVDGSGSGHTFLEPLLKIRRARRRAKLAHHGLAALVFGGGQMRANGFAVFCEGGGQWWYGEVR